MPIVFSGSDVVSLSAPAWGGSSSFTYASATEFTGGPYLVNDDNSPVGIDSDDYLNTPTQPYIGWVYIHPVSGDEYAIFQSVGDPNTYFIPHSGELTGHFAPGGATVSLTGRLTSTSAVNCFLEGTGIATDTGQTAVESLAPGDLIRTGDGRTIAVKWIGRQTVFPLFGPAERLRPVRFAAGSLGDGLPHSDLTVTADHGMLVDGVICHAGAMVNGTTITRVPLSELGESYTVYHVETESHEIILANGAPAETFIDNVSRRTFDNFGEFEALYGDVPEMEELPYPRAMSARQVPGHIQARLATQNVA